MILHSQMFIHNTFKFLGGTSFGLRKAGWDTPIPFLFVVIAGIFQCLNIGVEIITCGDDVESPLWSPLVL